MLHGDLCYFSSMLVDVGDEGVGDCFAVLVPVIAILLRAAMKIALIAVSDHAHEKERIEIGKRSAKSTTESPGEGHDGVGRVVDFASIAIPTIDEKRISTSCLDHFRILEGTPGKLGEGFALHKGAAKLHAEAVFLTVGCVPNIVGKEKGSKEEDEKGSGVLGIVFEDVERLKAIDKRYADIVPKDEHPAEFFIENIPSRRNAFFSFHTGVGIKTMRQDHEAHGRRDMPIKFVLFRSGGESEEEEEDPRDPNF